MGRGREVEPCPACLERDEEQLRSNGILEPADHLVTGRATYPAVQPLGLGAEPALQVGRQQLAPCAELGEAQHLVALFEDLLEQFLGTGELPGAATKRGPIGLEVGRVVAHLLEPKQPGQDQAPAVDALGLVRAGEELVDHGLVEGGLLAGERAAVDRLDLVRKVGDDRAVGLQPAEDERPRGPPEQCGGLGVVVALDGAWRSAPGTSARSPASQG
jgi:hypothetical protein